MSNIVDLLIELGESPTLKYYGMNDLATGIELKILITHCDEIKKHFKDKSNFEIICLDDFVDYLFLKKIIDTSEVLTYFKEEKDKEVFSDLNEVAKLKFDMIQTGDVIRFINCNIKEIFETEEKYYELITATLAVCEKYQNGINDEVFSFLISEHLPLILQKYNEFHKRIEKTENLAKLIFSKAVIKANVDNQLNNILNVVESLHKRKKDMFSLTDEAVDTIIDYGEGLVERLDKNTAIYIERKIKLIYKFLKSIEHVKANVFKNHAQKLDDLIDEYVFEHGQKFEHEVKIEKFQEIIKTDFPWITKLIQLTHARKSGSKILLRSILDMAPSKKFNLVDKCAHNINTNEYFTWTHQNNLNTLLGIGGIAIDLIVADKEVLRESLSGYLDCVQIICDKIGVDKKPLEEDIKNLFNMVEESWSSIVRMDAVAGRPLVYGLSMYICVLIEKILREVYFNVKKHQIYIPRKVGTLGQLLDDKNDLFPGLLGIDTVKSLRYFLCSDDGEVGCDYRNKLAHWNDITMKEMTPMFMYKLFYLLTCVLATLSYSFYQQDNERPEGESLVE